MTSGLSSYVLLSVSYLNLVSQVFITDSSALFVAAHACCRCSNAHQGRHHLFEWEAMRSLPYSSAALYPCCSDCKLSFSCNLLGGLAFYLDPEGSIFPFCWCLVFSSGVKIATRLQDSTHFSYKNVIHHSSEKDRMPAFIFWFFRLLGLCSSPFSWMRTHAVTDIWTRSNGLFGARTKP